MTKILHISNVVNKGGGGVSKVVNKLFSMQSESGLRASLWFWGNKADEEEILGEKDFQKLNILAVNKNILSFFKAAFLLFKNKGNDLVVHQHGIFLPISILSIISTRNAKTIINPHGYLEPEKMKVSSFKKRIVLALYERRNLRKSKCLVACSKKEAISLREFGLKQPIAIVPNGIDANFIAHSLDNKKEIKNIFREKNNIDTDKKILLFLSRIHPFKGLEVFLKSIFIIRDDFRKNNWIFMIAGTDELNHEAELKDFVKEKEIQDIVMFVGPKFGKNKEEILDSADCFVLPSKGENFGIVVTEAMARGLPVITTKSTPWAALNQNNCGWCIERDEKEFILTLKELFVTEDSKLLEMGKNGVRLVKNEYTWEKINSQFQNIYKWVSNDFEEKYKNGFELYKE